MRGALGLALERALRNLRYGTVQLVVHDGQIVRIERMERIRLTDGHGSDQADDGSSTAFAERSHQERRGSCEGEGRRSAQAS